MGILDMFKSQRDIAKEEVKETPWTMLTEKNQLDTIAEESKDKTVAIFKHSTRCGISRMVLRRFESEYEASEGKSIYMLDLLNHRDISDEIASKFGVFHQSPQLVVLKDGEVAHHASHQDISAQDI